MDEYVGGTMTEQYSIFDIIPDDGTGKNKPIKSTDWKWSFKDYPQKKNGLKVFSCFACGGGSTMGYKLAGCEVLGCVEIDPKMNEVYVRNHHPKYNFCMDLRDFNNLPNEEIPEELKHLDILDGSPPCTTFSMSGEREESWGKKKKFREGQREQTLDDLSFVFLDTVRKLKPKVVIMENVEGLLLGSAFEYVQQIYAKFVDAGYFVHHWLLKGEQMGVPQARHRVFFVACRADLGIDPSWLDMSFNYSPVVFSEIVGGEPPTMREDSQQYQMLIMANKNTDHSIKDVLMRVKGKSSCFNDLITWLDEVPPTLTGKGNVMLGDQFRKMSNLEVVRISSFPEDYDFINQSPRYVCGMSVPPVMMKRVVTRLIEQGVFDYAKSMHELPQAT